MSVDMCVDMCVGICLDLCTGEMFLVQMALDTKRAEIRKLEEQAFCQPPD